MVPTRAAAEGEVDEEEATVTAHHLATCIFDIDTAVRVNASDRLTRFALNGL